MTERYIASYCNESHTATFLLLFAKKVWEQLDQCYNIENNQRGSCNGKDL